MPVSDQSFKSAMVSRSNSDKQKRPINEVTPGMLQGSSAEELGSNTVKFNRVFFTWSVHSLCKSLFKYNRDLASNYKSLFALYFSISEVNSNYSLNVLWIAKD